MSLPVVQGGRRDSGLLLVVDDHADTREMLQDCLEEFGYSVDIAADGAEALERVRGGRYDLVISDLNMPRLDGLALLAAIRGETAGPDILMLSADGQVTRAVEAMRRGASNYLVKPVEIDELVAEVRAVMQARRDRAAERRSSDTTAVFGHHPRPRVPGVREVAVELPRTIGRYEVLRPIGAGGMGAIFKCFDPALGRLVAVKVIDDVTHRDRRDELLRRFACEAQAAGMLHHPNIVTVYDYAADPEGPVYLAMEYLDGSSLGELLSAGRLAWQRAVAIAFQIADALEFAHRNQVIHRDVKPANVLLLPGDAVKLLDFGVAKLANSELTVPGTVVGSPHYLAPECLRGARIDYRADQFALGSLLYEMVAGRRAFEFGDFYAGVHQILSDDPTPLEWVVPDGPTLLYEVVERLHRKDPERRYRNEMELLGELGRLCELAGAPLALALPRQAPDYLL
jgi:CheY-like chemotaxis protein